MKVTRAANEHVTAIVEIWKELMDFHKDLDPIYARSADAHANFEKHLRELMASGDSLVLVALEATRVAAYAIAQTKKRPPVFQHDTYGLVCDVAVTARYRRKGIGEKLLREILGWFESLGIHGIQVRVAAKNPVANAFWRKHGFRDHMYDLYLQT